MPHTFKALCIGDKFDTTSSKVQWMLRGVEREGLELSYSALFMAETLGILPRNRYQFDAPATTCNIGTHGVGIILAHMAAWNVVANGGDARPHLILENDVALAPDFVGRTEKALTRLPTGWDWCFIGGCGGKDNIFSGGEHIYDVRYPMCNHAYLITQVMADYLLSSIRKAWAPLDILLLIELFEGRKILTHKPSLAWQTGTLLL